MRIVRHASELSPDQQPVCAAIGIFDGVHLGHQALFQLVRSEARQQQGLAAAITFNPHPNAIVAPDRNPPLLQPLARRLDTLAQLGLDATLLIAFDEPFSRLPADTFIRDLAHTIGRLRLMVVGEGFTFGYRRSGHADLLRNLGNQLGFEVRVLPPVTIDGAPVRSTRIRSLLQEGDLPAVNRLLGRPYALAGTVRGGDRIGRTLGFPTANLDITGLALPPCGVYAAWARLPERLVPAVLNLGLRPTLHQTQPTLRAEAHLLGFDGDLYNRDLELELVQLLRPEMTFPSLDALRSQIRKDIETASVLLQPPSAR